MAVLGSTLNGQAPAARFAELTALQNAVGTGTPDLVVVGLPEFEAAKLGDDRLAVTTRAAVTYTLGLLRDWLALDALAASRLVIMTRGAVARRGEPVRDAVHAAASGLVRSAQFEHPDRFVLIDLDEDTEAVLASGTLAALPADEPQLAVRDGVLLVPRLSRVAAKTAAPQLGTGTVLITGGTGGLGAELAEHLVTVRGARRLALASRRGPDAPWALELRDRLLDLGAEAVDLIACDATDRASLASALASIDPAHPLTGIVHTAGVLADATITNMTPEQIETVLQPKVDAAIHLHELTADLELPLFAVFSSAAAAVGAPGQGNYAAANAFLEAVATQRRAAGLQAVALAWGLWATKGGMSGQVGEADVSRVRRTGFRPITPAEGLTAFDAATGSDLPVLLPSPVDPAMVRSLASTGGLLQVLRGLQPAATGSARKPARSLAERVAGLSSDEQHRVLTDIVREHVAVVLGHSSADAVGADTAFFDIGFDSLSAVELRNWLNTETGLSLPATLLFDHPDSAAVAAHLRELIVPAVPEAEPGSAPPSDIADMSAEQLIELALKRGDH
jgi:NAD(P)-dependent dehydrogenase (short-subunit alcohol dehydrogenase family)/acyl carrier protein